MTISLTAKHIKNGVRRASLSCPLALAGNDAFGVEDCLVGCFSLCVDDAWYDLPEDAQKFRKAFDEGKPVQPFSFEIEVPA